MTAVYFDHHGDEVSRVGQADVVREHEYLLEGGSPPMRVQALERPRETSRYSSRCCPTGPVVEVRRRELPRPSGNREFSPTRSATRTRSSRRRGLEGKIGIVD